MSSRKTERQLDLLFVLLNSSRALTRENIRQKIEDYRNQGSSEAFERMFERDKEELRDIGVPIETKKISSLFDDEVGYIISIKDFGVKEAKFNNSEMNELTRAALIWKDSLLSSGARIGLVKNATASKDALDLDQDFAIDEIVSDHLYIKVTQAVTHGMVIEFMYVKPQEKTPSSRRVLPEKLTTKGPFVYITAFDFKDQKYKNFNLSRVSGGVTSSHPTMQEIDQIKSSKNLGYETQQIKTAFVKPLIDPLALKHSLGGVEKNGYLEIEFYDEEAFAILLAPYSFDIQQILPISLSKLVVEQLEILRDSLK